MMRAATTSAALATDTATMAASPIHTACLGRDRTLPSRDVRA